MGRHDWTFAFANIWPDVHCLQAKFRGTQREILRKGPKTITKHDSKLSEVILKSILAECWEEFICSSLSARTDGAVPSQQGALTTCDPTNQEVSPQTYVQTILASLGVVLRQNSPHSYTERARTNQLNSLRWINKKASLTGAVPESSERGPAMLHFCLLRIT